MFLPLLIIDISCFPCKLIIINIIITHSKVWKAKWLVGLEVHTGGSQEVTSLDQQSVMVYVT